MRDFITPFWSYYVAGLVVLSLLFCAWVLASNTTKRVSGAVELHGHTWDENLQEWNHPLPRWWMYLFWMTIVFGVGYLILWPGVGDGYLGWSSHAQYDLEQDAAQKAFDAKFARFENMDVKALAGDHEAHEMGQRLFLTYCVQCHGSDAKGARGFPNLTNKEKRWGGEPEKIVETITGGRSPVMPSWKIGGGGPKELSNDEIRDVANYVRSIAGLANDSIRAQRGKDIFQNCAACHGPEGKGTPAMGAPNLTNPKTWIYGSSEASVVETVTKGRQGRMPAFKELLGDKKIKLLAGYVYGLSAASAPAATAAN